MTDSWPEFHQLAATRQSIRHFQQEEVPAATVERILQTACQAPSAHNRQPWRFVVLPPGEARERLVEAMSRRFRRDLEEDGVPKAEIEEIVERGRRRMVDPPMAIVLCMTMAGMDEYPDEKRQLAEWTMATQSAALAGGHLLLAAHAEGLGACWVCAPLFVPEVVRDQLDLPADWQAQGVIVLGRAAEQGRNRSRRPLDEVSVWR